MEEASLSIGEVAARAGVSVSALRYYERIGLLPAAEREQGRRRFPVSTVRRLGIVAAAPLRTLAGRGLPKAEAQVAEAEGRRDWLLAASACGCASLDDCALFVA